MLKLVYSRFIQRESAAKPFQAKAAYANNSEVQHEVLDVTHGSSACPLMGDCSQVKIFATFEIGAGSAACSATSELAAGKTPSSAIGAILGAAA